MTSLSQLCPNLVEFSLNDFYWILWILTKSKSDMNTRATTYLVADTI